MKWSCPPHSTLPFTNSQHIPESPQKRPRPRGLSRVTGQGKRVQSQEWAPSELALCPKQSQLSSQMCGAHVPVLSCVPCAHYLLQPPKDPEPPVRSAHSPCRGTDGSYAAVAPTRQRGVQSLSRCDCSGLTPATGLGPEQGFTAGGHRGCRITTEALGKAGPGAEAGGGEAGPWTAPVAREERRHRPKQCLLQPCRQLGTMGHVHTLRTPSEDALISGAPSR